jgi:hypothetical protein
MPRLAAIFVILLSPLSAAEVVSDLSVYSVPQTPLLPRAGQTFVDPSFGATLLRATDSDYGWNCIHAYSIWPSFNSGSTRFLVNCDDTQLLFDFDPDAFRITGVRLLMLHPAPSGRWLNWEDMIWSGTDPDILYGRESSRIWSFNVSTGEYKLVKDFAQELYTAPFISRVTATPDGNTFAFTRSTANGTFSGFGVWRKDLDRVIATETFPDYYKVQIDKTGRYLLIGLQRAGAGAIQAQVLDLQSRVLTNLTDDGPDFAPGHGDLGRGICVAYENWFNRVLYRELARPKEWRVLLDQRDDWSQESHYSMLADEENWLLVSNVSYGARFPGLFRDEIFQLKLDGSGEVRRLAHHHSKYAGYWDSPRANISRDGRFVLFTSNWGSTRRDVFILRVPAAGAPVPAPPGQPPSPPPGEEPVQPLPIEPPTEPPPPEPAAIEQNGF